MSSHLRRALCFGLTAGGFVAPPACSALAAPGSASIAVPVGRRLKLVASVLPPYVLPVGHALGEGADIDMAREALAVGAGYGLDVQLVPWRRALLMLESGDADFTTGVRVTPERERFLVFSQHYGDSVRYAFYSRSADSLRIERLEDLAGHRVALVAGAELAPPVRDAITGPVELAVDLQTAMRMLDAGRARLVVANMLPALWVAQQTELAQRLRRQLFSFDTGVQTQMGFSTRRQDHGAALQAMNRGLSQLVRAGRWEAIQSKYVAR